MVEDSTHYRSKVSGSRICILITALEDMPQWIVIPRLDGPSMVPYKIIYRGFPNQCNRCRRRDHAVSNGPRPQIHTTRQRYCQRFLQLNSGSNPTPTPANPIQSNAARPQPTRTTPLNPVTSIEDYIALDNTYNDISTPMGVPIVNLDSQNQVTTKVGDITNSVMDDITREDDTTQNILLFQGIEGNVQPTNLETNPPPIQIIQLEEQQCEEAQSTTIEENFTNVPTIRSSEDVPLPDSNSEVEEQNIKILDKPQVDFPLPQ